MVLIHDPADAQMTWKLQLDTGADWFKAEDVLELTGSKAWGALANMLAYFSIFMPI